MRQIKTIYNGEQFGKWKVIDGHFYVDRKVYYLCECDCGIQSQVRATALRFGSSTACRKCANTNRGSNNLYSFWQGMKTKCYNQKQRTYKHFGALGIEVYPEWKDNYKAFKTYVKFYLGTPKKFLDR